MRRNILFLLCFIFIMAISLTGCNSSADSGDKPDETTPPVQQSESAQKEVTLYFANASAEGLVAEKRSVEVKDDADLPAILVEELIAGPKDQDLSPTIPPETQLRSVEVTDKVAAVDFSGEIITKHWGGSAGETMTILSVVDTLTELDSIDKVQFMVDGQKVDSLLGHWDTSMPLERDERIIME